MAPATSPLDKVQADAQRVCSRAEMPNVCTGWKADLMNWSRRSSPDMTTPPILGPAARQHNLRGSGAVTRPATAQGRAGQAEAADHRRRGGSVDVHSSAIGTECASDADCVGGLLAWAHGRTGQIGFHGRKREVRLDRSSAAQGRLRAALKAFLPGLTRLGG